MYLNKFDFSKTVYRSILAFGSLFLLCKLDAQTKSFDVASPNIAFRSSIKFDNIDTTVYNEWVDGKERQLWVTDPKTSRIMLPFWTDKTETTSGFVLTYGKSKTNSPKHFRIGLRQVASVGSIIALGGGHPSVLKEGAKYPGDLNDESQWIPAKRLINGDISDKETNRNEYAVWVFPPNTKTRAIRFSHHPNLTDATYSCDLIGALVTEDRYCNIAPLAKVTAKSNFADARMLVDESENTWSNLDGHDSPSIEALPPISNTNQEWVVLNWEKAVRINGLITFFPGFNTAEVQAYTNNSKKKLNYSDDNQWQPVAQFNKIPTVPSIFYPVSLDLNNTITTNAIKFKMRDPYHDYGNLGKATLGGRRTWLNELMVLQPLGNEPLQPVTNTIATTKTPTPPIEVPFTINEAGYVTLVIEDNNGVRVRNLVSDTWFNAGKNVVYWDGLDDLGRDVSALHHGIYNIPKSLVLPGAYKVRGIYHGEIKTTLDISFYSTGNPPWDCDDHTGAWLGNQTAPQSAVSVPAEQSPTGQPAVFLGCSVTEGVDGMAWVDLDGKKMGGERWIGGNWTAAPFIARDASGLLGLDTFAFVGAVGAGRVPGQVEIRITALTAKGDKAIMNYQLNSSYKGDMGGLAVNKGIAVVSYPQNNKLLFFDVRDKKIIDSITVNSPTGLAFDLQGKLLVLSSNNLLKYNVNAANIKSSVSQTILSTGLENPHGITLDAKGNIYISDGGNSNQVKVFSATGKLLHTIGNPGPSKAGPYDSLHMNNPFGITIDSKQQLWVAEYDFIPKRVSVWKLDGSFVKAIYGPAKYGGGGTIDPQDKSKLYYAEGGQGTMEFALDWKTGDSKIKNILYRKTSDCLDLAFRSAGPETPIYYNGKRYFTNCYNSNPTNGPVTAFIFTERNGTLFPAAAIGNAQFWDVLKKDIFKSKIPDSVDLKQNYPRVSAYFIWNDLNEDGQVQPEEVNFKKGKGGGVTVMNDLSFCLRVDDKAMQFLPSLSPTGLPTYQFDNSKVLVSGVQQPGSDGGDQILVAPNGYTVATVAISPFNGYSVSGAKEGKPIWTYPDLWPSLHLSHEAPLPSFRGELIGTTRLLGGLLDMKGSESGPLWALNSNHGMVYLFTSDGLFLTTLFEPMRSGIPWKMPIAQRGMDLKGLSLGEENFWPTITQTQEGDVYIVEGSRASIIKVDGLQNTHLIPPINLSITATDLKKCSDYQLYVEAQRQNNVDLGILNVPITSRPITVDGKLDDWPASGWVDIDKSGVAAYFNARTKPNDVTGAITVSNNKLYIAYKTGDAQLLKNTGDIAIAPFKTGGALDLMIGTDPNAKLDRQSPVDGDLRLLVTIIKGKPNALVYRAVASGAKQSDKVPFSSPWRTITFDKVEDLSSKIEFAASPDGNYEVSVPLAVLNLVPKDGLTIKGDIGILRGDGTQTLSRIYWNNKATGIVSDVPSEAELTPSLWGTLQFKAQ